MDEENKNITPDENTGEEETGKDKNTGEDIVGEIAGELSQEVAEEEGDGVVNPSAALPFDFSKLSKDELQNLKSMLNATPDSRVKKIEKGSTRLRKIDGKIVVDIKRTFTKLVEDPENHRQVYKLFIPIKFYGEDEYKDVLYENFINSEQIKFTKESERKETEEKIVGVVFSMELGREIEAVEKKTHKWFSVKMEDGKVIELPNYVGNA